MFTSSQLRRRRPRTSHVVKYLEGIPRPTTLLDHLAGANLLSGGHKDGRANGSGSPQFFTTVPRYLDCKHENRLSKLFFHHVLYPAGGARVPTQAVVIRGGRSVVPCRPRHISLASSSSSGRHPTSTSNSRHREAERGQATAAIARTDHVQSATADPLAVPASQLAAGPPSSSTNPPPRNNRTSSSYASASPTDATFFSPEQGHYNSSHWTRSDPARPSYFYAPHTSRDKPSHKGFQFEQGSPRVIIAPPLRYERSHGTDPHDNSSGGGTGPHREQFSSLLLPGSGGGTAKSGGPRGSAISRQTGPVRPHRPTSASREEGQRSVCDEALAALRGAVEAAFATPSSTPRDEAESTGTEQQQQHSADILARIAASAVTPSAGLMQYTQPTGQGAQENLKTSGGRDSIFASFEPFPNMSDADSVSRLIAAACVQHARPSRIARDGAENQGPRSFVAYMQSNLPAEAVVALPVVNDTNTDNKSGSEFICRLAGGLEPFVNFAVGTPLLAKRRVEQSGGGDDDGGGGGTSPFSFLSCLLRLEGTVSDTGKRRTHGGSGGGDGGRDRSSQGSGETVTEAPARKKGAAAVAKSHDAFASLEPWRLGGPALDPSVRYTARTVSESSGATPSPPSQSTASTSSEREQPLPPFLLGRADGESYLVPQRELLLTLFVPPRTAALCEEQNASRLAKQVKLGHAPPSPPPPPSSHHPTGSKAMRTGDDDADTRRGWDEASRRSFLAPSVGMKKKSSSRGAEREAGAASDEKGSRDGADDAAVAAAFGFLPGRGDPAKGHKREEEEEEAEAEGAVYVAPSEHRRMTADRLLQRQLHNAKAAMRTGTQPNGEGRRRRPLQASASGDVLRYEVRALPGDVVYIPRGWAYVAKRIVGTAVVDLAAAAAEQSAEERGHPRTAASSPFGRGAGTHVYSNKNLALSNGTARNSAQQRHKADAATAGDEPQEEEGRRDDDTAPEEQPAPTPHISKASVDAFILNYKPYPLLSRGQAAVYISANYAHGGIEAFYDKGGNPLFYKYE